MYRVELLEEKARRERAVEALERRKRADEQSKAEKSSAGEQKVEKASRTPVKEPIPSKASLSEWRATQNASLKTVRCYRCDGQGRSFKFDQADAKCCACDGFGSWLAAEAPSRCPACGGAGRILSRRTLQELPSSHGSHEALVEAFLDGSIVCEGCNGLGGVRSFQGKQSYMSELWAAPPKSPDRGKNADNHRWKGFWREAPVRSSEVIAPSRFLEESPKAQRAKEAKARRLVNRLQPRMPSPREPPQAPINFVKLAMGPLTVYEGRFDRKGATGAALTEEEADGSGSGHANIRSSLSLQHPPVSTPSPHLTRQPLRGSDTASSATWHVVGSRFYNVEPPPPPPLHGVPEVEVPTPPRPPPEPPTATTPARRPASARGRLEGAGAITPRGTPPGRHIMNLALLPPQYTKSGKSRPARPWQVSKTKGKEDHAAPRLWSVGDMPFSMPISTERLSSEVRELATKAAIGAANRVLESFANGDMSAAILQQQRTVSPPRLSPPPREYEKPWQSYQAAVKPRGGSRLSTSNLRQHEKVLAARVPRVYTRPSTAPPERRRHELYDHAEEEEEELEEGEEGEEGEEEAEAEPEQPLTDSMYDELSRLYLTRTLVRPWDVPNC